MVQIATLRIGEEISLVVVGLPLGFALQTTRDQALLTALEGIPDASWAERFTAREQQFILADRALVVAEPGTKGEFGVPALIFNAQHSVLHRLDHRRELRAFRCQHFGGLDHLEHHLLGVHHPQSPPFAADDQGLPRVVLQEGDVQAVGGAAVMTVHNHDLRGEARTPSPLMLEVHHVFAKDAAVLGRANRGDGVPLEFQGVQHVRAVDVTVTAREVRGVLVGLHHVGKLETEGLGEEIGLKSAGLGQEILFSRSSCHARSAMVRFGFDQTLPLHLNWQPQS